MRFSQRKGLKPVSSEILKDYISDDLKNSLWSLLKINIFTQAPYQDNDGWYSQCKKLSTHLWFNFFKKPIDTIPYRPAEQIALLRNKFFKYDWYELYDFIECIVQYESNNDLSNSFNQILERELAGYRFIDNILTDITDEQEVNLINEVLNDDQYSVVSSHLRRALELLSDKKSPDYRNSIKESISGVESICKIITKKSKGTLSDALKILEKNKHIHPALKEGFSKIYGYTNDEDGIRHAMIDEPNITQADAKFFLLSCTSFVNYIKSIKT